MVIILLLFVGVVLLNLRKRMSLHCDVLQYFFYFNRLAGIIVSAILRVLLWKSNNAHIHIGGLSFSVLGGRIILSDVRYISRNQSLRIVRAHITFRYWLRHVRSEEDKPEGEPSCGFPI